MTMPYEEDSYFSASEPGKERHRPEGGLPPFVELAMSLFDRALGDPMEAVGSRALNLPSAARERLINLCVEALDDPSVKKNQLSRVAWARLLVALFKDTFPLILHLLERRQDRWDYEMHFSLFCYLDWIPEWPDGQPFVPVTLEAVKKYLLSVDREVALASWMAGHLLGDHWDPKTALPVLLECAINARFAAGRLGAITGLEDRLSDPEQDTAPIRQVLELLQETNRSPRVRLSAAYALEKMIV